MSARHAIPKHQGVSSALISVRVESGLSFKVVLRLFWGVSEGTGAET